VKVTVSIPDEVIEFLNWPNSSSRTVALRSTQSLTEMSTGNLPGGKKGVRRVRLTTSPPIVGASTSHNPMGHYGLLQG
jgi:hypothetical protein